MTDTLVELVLDMFKLNMLKFGEFTLKSGKKSYIYADIRTAISYPTVYKQICYLLYNKMNNLPYDFICGVPYSALTFASGIAYANNIPQLLKRKEAKSYATKNILEGVYQAGQRVIIIEDVVTTGSSILDTIQVLQEHGLVVSDVICLLNRQQGGSEMLHEHGYNLHSVMQLQEVLTILVEHERISNAQLEQALAAIAE